MLSKNGISFSFAALLQVGTLSAAEPVNVFEPISNTNAKESEGVNFSSSNLGISGPIEVVTSYNDDFGIIVGAKYSTYINYRNALAFEAEGGQNLYRLNGTWGFAINERNRVKFSLERLADNDDYDFASGTESEWIAQNAVGGSYQYIVDAGWLQAIDVNAYGAKAESKDYDDVVFYDGDNPFVNKRRIAGGTSLGGSLGMTVLPLESTRAEVGLHYDAVNYDMKYDDSDPSTSGFGFSVDVEHVFSRRFKGNIGADVLSTDHTYEAGLTWLAPTKMGSDLELSLLAGYLNGQTTDDDNYQVGVQASYSWDHGTATEQKAGYSGFKAVGVEDLRTWSRDPAVRMPEVMAVVDEAVFDAIPTLDGSVPDITRSAVSPIDFSVAPYFSNADGSALKFTATGLPSTITMNSNGRLEGDTPDVAATQNFDITTTATNKWGFQQQDSFVLTVLADLLPPTALAIPSPSLEEQSRGQVNLSSYFIDPNLPASKGSSASSVTDRPERLAFTYTLSNKPQGWNTFLELDEHTGVLTGVVPLYNAAGNNSYDFTVTATNYAGSVDSSFTVNVIDINRVDSTAIPKQSFLEGQNVDGLLNLADYFSSENNSELSYTASASLEASGLSVTEDGLLTGIAVSVTETTTYNATVTATNTEGATATRPLVVVVEAYAGDIVLDGTIPEQTVVEDSGLDASNSVNLNDYFSNSEDGSIAYTSDDLSNIGATSIDADGVIVGTVKSVDSNTVTTVNVEAFNPDDADIAPVNAQIDYTLLAIPTSETIPSQQADERSVYSLDVNTSGTGNFQPEVAGDLSYTLSGAPAGWSINEQGVISGTVPDFDSTIPANNDYSLTVTAANALDASLVTAQSFSFTVLDLSSEIDVSTIPVQNVQEDYQYQGGQAIDLNQVFTDTEGNELVFSDNGQLADIGLSIDSNGLIVGKVTVDANVQNLTIPIVASEKDDSSITATTDIIFNIAALVTSDSLTDQSADEDADYVYNTAVEGNFQPYNASNPQADQNLSFSLTGAPASLTIDSVTGVISGVATYVVGGNNTYNMTVTATNVMDSSLTSSQSFQFTVETSSITITGVPGQQKAPEGTTYSAGSNAIDLKQVFTDSADNEMEFTDDGRLADIGLSIDNDGFIVGTLTVDANVFDLPVNITATEKDNSDVTASIAINYTVSAEVTSDDLLDQVIEAESTSVPYSFDAGQEGNFQPDANANLTFSMTGAPQGIQIDSSTGQITGNIPYNTGGNNTYSVTVTAENTLNAATGANFSSSETYQLELSPGVALTPVTSQPFPQEGTTGRGEPYDAAAFQYEDFSYNAATKGNFQPFNSQDTSSNTLKFSMSGNPSYLSIDPDTGVIRNNTYIFDEDIPFLDGYLIYDITVTAVQKADSSLKSSQVLEFIVGV